MVSKINVQFLQEDGPAKLNFTKIHDERGFFARIFCEDTLNSLINFGTIKQVNVSYSASAGTVRGLHYQNQPSEEAKIVYCLEGEINDYVVDVRENSVDFGRVFTVNLKAFDAAVFVPAGFAHGFQSLADHTRLLYLHNQNYCKEREGGISIFSSALDLNFAMPITQVSERDQNFRDLGA